MLALSRWSQSAAVLYSLQSKMTGPMFLSKGLMIFLVLFWMVWRRCCCCKVRFVGCHFVLAVMDCCCRSSAKFSKHCLNSAYTAGGFHVDVLFR